MDPTALIVRLLEAHRGTPEYVEGIRDLQSWYERLGYHPTVREVLTQLDKSGTPFPRHHDPYLRTPFNAAQAFVAKLIHQYGCSP